MDNSATETNPWHAVYDAIVTDALQSLQVVYDEFNVSLQEWLNDILNHPIPEDWRGEVARFVQQTERNGLEILPESIRSIEAIIESCIAGTDEFTEIGPAPRGPAAAESAPPFVVSIAPEVSGPPGQQPASSERAPRSIEELKIRARQLGYAFQKQLGLTDAERALVEEYFVRVFATGVAEPLPKFVQDKLDERARKIAAQQDQPGLAADTRTDRQRRDAELRVLQDKSHTPDGLTLAERNRLQDLLEIAIVDQAVDIHENQGMLGLLFNPASFVNIDNLAILATPFAKGATPIDPLAGQTVRGGSQSGQTTGQFEPITGTTIMKPGARAQFRPGSPEPPGGPDSLPTKPQAPGTQAPEPQGLPEPNAAAGVAVSSNIPTSQLEKKWKHAADFGITTQKRNPTTLAAYGEAVASHLNDAATIEKGTYLYVSDSKVYFNPLTNLVVVLDKNGVYVSGWKLAPGTPQFQKFVKDGVLR